MLEASRLRPLIAKIAEAREPSRQLCTDVWFATTDRQHPDIKARFALLVEAKAWMDAALLTAAYALPGWVVVATIGPGPGEAKLRLPGSAHRASPAGLKAVRHPAGAALAILQVVTEAKAQGH